MIKEFVPCEMAFKLKELGFDEVNLAAYVDVTEIGIVLEIVPITETWVVGAPLWQQAYEWLIKKLDFYYPYLELSLFCDYSGDWKHPHDGGVLAFEIEFDNKQQMFETAIQLLIDGKNHKYID